jgi:hypothetical protein
MPITVLNTYQTWQTVLTLLELEAYDKLKELAKDMIAESKSKRESD